MSALIISPKVAVLFARADSVYKALPECDVWDIDRDARSFGGGMPAICHPPCRAWGQLRHFAHPRPDEKDLARFSVAVIRENGGMLEHPARSLLWLDQGLPLPGCRDAFGFTVSFPQFWFGHKAQKNTWLYVCRIEPRELPPLPLVLGSAEFVVSSGSIARGQASSQGAKRGITKAQREHTPASLARWLVDVALLIPRF